ncbi:HEAT repeat domain-containing protein [Stenomitos frigidus]|uniref:PBS lyase n=1 Tax=Stenomitos frigidus ULC18 TaxID=2107698 RepID=A0A2T1E9G8_9CYAN|nr:HEAT repeat domain-containing protein [Stenomitos frigidus]PSB29392.1 PBS lyase [Stenomitos frigidus ULC18]
MSNILEPAEAALKQGKWPLLYQCLHQVLIDRTPEQLSDHTAARVVELAIAVLEAGDFQDRWDVAKLLPAFGNRAIAPLVGLLQDDDADLEARWFVARILSSYSQPGVVITLAKLLQTAVNEELRSIAAEALAHMGSPAIAALTDLLVQDDTRLFAVRSLVQIRRAETIDPLLRVVDDPQPTIRAIAIEALGSFHDHRVPPVLMCALSDPSAAVRQQAVVGLGVRTDLVDAMPLVPLLADRLLDLDLEVCQRAAVALGRMRTDAAAIALYQTLKASQTPLPLQLRLVQALGWMETAIALDSLHQALLCLEASTAFRPVHQEIITVIGRWTDPALQVQATQVLLSVLSRQSAITVDPAVRQAIAVSLGALGQLTAIESLMQLLADEDLSVRLHAIAALKALDASTAHQQLEALIKRTDVPEALKQGAAIALQEW